MSTKVALPFAKLFRGLAKKPQAVAAVPVAPPVGREISLAKIMARLRARSPKHAQRLQDMLSKRGLQNTANEMESGGFRAAPGMDVTKQAALEKVAKFMISKGPETAKAYLEGWKKLLAAKALEKAPAEVQAQQPSALAKLIKKKKKKSKPLYGVPSGRGTAAFRFGD